MVENVVVKNDMYEVAKQMYKLSMNNCFHYIISSQKEIKEIIIELYQNGLNIPKGPFEDAVKFLRGKEKKLIKKAIPYSEYITYWGKNYQECILDYEWIFEIQQTTNIRFHQVCQIIDVDEELIKRLFQNLKKMEINEMIETHKRYRSSNIYNDEEYQMMTKSINA